MNKNNNSSILNTNLFFSTVNLKILKILLLIIRFYGKLINMKNKPPSFTEIIWKSKILLLFKWPEKVVR